jgi:hypothetical protein
VKSKECQLKKMLPWKGRETRIYHIICLLYIKVFQIQESIGRITYFLSKVMTSSSISYRGGKLFLGVENTSLVLPSEEGRPTGETVSPY